MQTLMQERTNMTSQRVDLNKSCKVDGDYLKVLWIEMSTCVLCEGVDSVSVSVVKAIQISIWR